MTNNLTFEQKMFNLEKSQRLDDSIFNDFSTKYSHYFSNIPRKLVNFEIIKDECLFKNLMRFDPERKINYKLVKNPFVKSRYSINNYNKIWYVKFDDKIRGPYNAFQMDTFYFKNNINENTQVSLNLEEFFYIKDFINSVYYIQNNYQKSNTVIFESKEKVINNFYSPCKMNKKGNNDVKIVSSSATKMNIPLKISSMMNIDNDFGNDNIVNEEVSDDLDRNIKKMIYDICEEEFEDDNNYSRRITRKSKLKYRESVSIDNKIIKHN